MNLSFAAGEINGSVMTTLCGPWPGPEWVLLTVGEPGILSDSSLVLLSAFQGRHCGLISAPSTVSSRTVPIQTLIKL